MRAKISRRSTKVSLMRRTIINWMRAIKKHGPVDGYVRSLAHEERTLTSFLNGETDENGFPPQ